MEVTEISIDRWMDKDVVYLYNGILLSHGKGWNIVICSNVELEIILLSEVSQTEKNKYHLISLIYRILKKVIETNIYKTEKDSQT